MNACTLWLDRLGPYDWHQCCVQHDWDYAHLVGKALADDKLEHCVNAVFPGMGSVMWAGVTVFGGLWYLKAMVQYFGRRRA